MEAKDMSWKVMVLATIIIGLFCIKQTIADDCDRDCNNRCLLRNPFGGCVQRGNDPLCQFAKEKCLSLRRVPPAVKDAIPVFIPSLDLKVRCLNYLVDCPQSII